MVDAGEIEHAQLLCDRPAAESAAWRPGLATLGEVLEEGGRVVALEPLVGVAGHLAPRRPVIAGTVLPWFLEQSLQVLEALLEVERDLSRPMPRRTIAKATVGWMPTMTVSAPRSWAAWARLSSVRSRRSP